MLDNLKRIEDKYLNEYDLDLLIDEDPLFYGNNYDKFRSYVKNLYFYYLEDQIISDIRSLESLDADVKKKVDEDWIAMGYLSESICKLLYENRSQLQFDKVLSELKQAVN